VTEEEVTEEGDATDSGGGGLTRGGRVDVIDSQQLGCAPATDRVGRVERAHTDDSHTSEGQEEELTARQHLEELSHGMGDG
jgi:hypothetical protein